MRAPIFRGNVVNGKIKLDTRERFREYLQSFEGKRIELILREKPTNRSENQNRYYWGVALPLLGEHLGYTNEEMHKEAKKKFIISSTSKLSTKEFEDYLSQFKQWAVQEFGVRIPDPNEVDF